MQPRHVRLALGGSDADVTVRLAQEALAVDAAIHPCVHHRLRGERTARDLAEPVAAPRNRVARVHDAVLERLLALAAVIEAVLLDHHVRVLLGDLRERPDGLDLLHVGLAPLLADQTKDGLAQLVGGRVSRRRVRLRALRGLSRLARAAEQRERAQKRRRQKSKRREASGVGRPCHVMKLNRRRAPELRFPASAALVSSGAAGRATWPRLAPAAA